MDPARLETGVDRPAIVANFRAGGGAVGRDWLQIKKVVEDQLGACSHFLAQEYESGYHATCAAVQSNAKYLIVVGGDGTLNEVINGLMHTASWPQALPLGIVPNGTGCDLVRTLGIPGNVHEAVQVIASGHAHSMDLGYIRAESLAPPEMGRYFHNVCSFGLGGAVAEQVNRSHRRFNPRLTFLGAALRAVFRYRPQEVELILDDRRKYLQRVWNVAIANGQYHGGGMWVAPEARIDDGLLDVILIKGMPVSSILRHLPKLYNGRMGQVPGVLRGVARRVRVLRPKGLGLDIDGEALGCLPAEVSVVPQAITLLGKSTPTKSLRRGH